ncbi:GPI transamidase component PIG-S-like [Mytilus edulis]|uniref:PIGS n=1 Tax=Mytilus edulis TaxID=6550 RepID=A0A8S3TZB0_MYTED|nr:PIGS [Mytilus edulis]
MKKSEEKQKPVTQTWTQIYAALGVGFVYIIIGLPLWWKTTEVYRVSLPYSDIEELYQAKLKYTVDLEVINFDVQITDVDLTSLSGLLTSLLASKENDIYSKYRVNVRQCTQDERVHEKLELPGLDEKLHLEDEKQNRYEIYLLPKKLTKPYIGTHHALYLSTKGRELSSVSEDIVRLVKEYFVRESVLMKTFQATKGQNKATRGQKITQQPDKESMRAVKSNDEYDITFSLVNPQPDILDAHWDIEYGVSYLDPLILKIEQYAKLNIKSQVMYYTGLLRRPKSDEKKGEFYYDMEDLPHTINPLEVKLGSHASNNPTLNFLTYVPSRNQHPLYICQRKGVKVESNSFLSPRWGGIFIYNVPNPGVNDTLPVPVSLDMKSVMEVFITQLKLLLNIQSVSPDTVEIADPQNKIISEWELDNWLRYRCIENLGTSASTLKSLAQLLGKIRNMVIQDHIGKLVEEAVSAIKSSHNYLAQGKLDKAFLKSKQAFKASETAFFDPSLLELLYFPEDQKFAIYIPLFLPISLPVIASLYKAFKWIKEQKAKVKQE